MTVKFMINDFWTKFGQAYLVFSKFCDYEDWQSILKRIAEEIIAIQANRPLAVLDVGAGYGINTMYISNIVFNHSRIRSVIDIIEPSKQARETAINLLVREVNGGTLKDAFSNLAEIGKRKYDIILFLHSSYYIQDFHTWLKKIYVTNLRQGGKILILAIPDDSPFFIDPRSRLQFTSSQLKFTLSQGGFDFTPHQLRSRFYVNTNFVISSTEADQLYLFMAQTQIPNMSKEEFCLKLKEKASDGVINLGDELLVIRKIK